VADRRFHRFDIPRPQLAGSEAVVIDTVLRGMSQWNENRADGRDNGSLRLNTPPPLSRQAGWRSALSSVPGRLSPLPWTVHKARRKRFECSYRSRRLQAREPRGEISTIAAARLRALGVPRHGQPPLPPSWAGYRVASGAPGRDSGRKAACS
jgi:hypothetical protein